MNPNAFSQQGPSGISPAMLNSFQHQQKQPTTLNPAQLLNGGGMNMNMNSMNGINPAQLMQQQMGGMGSINPAALSAPSPSPQQSQSQSLNINNMLSAVGMSRDQFTSLSHHQQQMVGAKYMAMAQQQHQHQQQQMQMQQGMQMLSHQSIGQSYDRPSSSASSHSQPGQAHMMPPPPPRPPTAQGGMHQQFSAQQGQHISRPGTALSHRSPTIPGPGLAMMDGQRPQSSLSQRDGMNGFKPGQQQQQQFNQSQQSASSLNAPTRSPSQQGNLPSPQQQQASQNPSQNANANANLSQIPNPGPNPPYSLSTSPTNRGAKRKATGDVIQGGMGGMGSMSGMGGMGNMGNVGGMGNVGNVGGMGGSMGGMGGGMGSMGGMNMNMNANANAMGMGNMSTMNMGMGVPGSPRIGSGNTMGPPGLPRSISGDNIGGMGMAGMGNMGGGMGGNMGGMGNANMNMMNGARHSPRPQSSMGMSGMGSMGNMNVGGGMGNMNSMGGMNDMASMNNMGNMGMGMNVDVPSRMGPQGMSSHAQGMQTGNIGSPQTPMRQGSLPPQTPLPVQQMGMGMGGMPQGSMGPQTPVQAHQAMRQSSVPPSATGGRGSLPPGTGGAMGIGAPSSPLPGIAGPQIAPSMSASSMGSMSGAASATAALPSSAGVTGGAPIGGIGAPGLSASASVSSTSGPSGSVPASASSTGTSGLPPLPANVKLNPATTVITTVPLLTSTSAIPALEDEEVQKIKEWMEVDKAYDARLRTMRQRAGEEARVALGLGVGPAVDGNTRNKGWAGSGAIMWWERGAPGNGMGNWNRYRRGREGFDVRYPKVRRDGHGLSRSGRKGAKREGLRLPRKIDPEDANRPEQLVPIRVEFDVEHHKMRDTFVWNLNDPVVTPEAFAQSVVEDYGLASSYHSIIVKSIQDQLSDYNAHMANLDSHDHEGSGVIKGSLDEKETTWWEAWRRKLERDSGNTSSRNKEKRPHREGSKQRSNKKKRKTTKQESEEGQDDDASMFADNELEYDEDRKAVSFAGDEETDLEMDLEDEFRPLSIDEIKVNEQNMHEDMRILIKLDIIVASIKLDDQFEWDLDNPDASPEEFAEVYTQELGLGGEFK
ncbi:hypothetical protein NLJ89_g10962 [Agrocybe chaxingu]|uniref:SNF5-domain-containing protein n=1 Tax=Agrocybe chaxingu TaxID=84603 RepID=A0A9W8MPT3_9AGAR|nr:hypothetical protein NLJ89_g10962 [Agrocybe chaxingu]